LVQGELDVRHHRETGALLLATPPQVEPLYALGGVNSFWQRMYVGGMPSSAPRNCEIGLEPFPTRQHRIQQLAGLVGSEQAIPPIDKVAA
jgi:hypothetical protein